MNRVLSFAVMLLFSISYSLDYSTLEMQAIDQNGAPVEGVNFFLTCKMTFTTVERFLCTSGMNGTCRSACMDCAPGLPATVRAKYLNQTPEQEIFSWEGSDAESCKPFYSTSNPLDVFHFETFAAPEPPEEDDGKGAAESIPENVNIETKDYVLSTQEDEEYEYVSYLEQKTPQEPQEEEGCLPAFALAGLFAFLFMRPAFFSG